MTVDLSDRQVIPLTCDACSRAYNRVVIFATKDASAHALVSVVCHGHDGEVWMDATFGSWDEPYADHATFSCRVGAEGAALVDGLVASGGEAPHYGDVLSRARALADPRLAGLWVLVDEVVVTVPEVSDALATSA